MHDSVQPGNGAITLTVALPPDQIEALAQRVAALLARSGDDGSSMLTGRRAISAFPGMPSTTWSSGGGSLTASRGRLLSTGPSFAHLWSAADGGRPHSQT